MDNTKIFIDIDDEITFVAERIFAAQTRHVILVIPERAVILGSLASLQLLQHVVAKTEKQVILVTMDEVGRVLAQRAGFMVRGRVGEVEATIWDTFDTPKVAGEQEAVLVPPVEAVHIPAPGEVTVGMATPEEAAEDTVLVPEVLAQPIEPEAVIEEGLPEGTEEGPQPPEGENAVSVNDMKSLNPPVYELTGIGVEKQEENVAEEPVKPQPPKAKFVESVKIVKLDGFELVVGGDAAIVKKSRELERKVISQKADTIATFHYEAQDGAGPGIIGKDIEASLPKKKVVKIDPKLERSVMQTMDKVHTLRRYYVKKWMYAPIVLVLVAMIGLATVFMPTAAVTIHVSAKDLTDTSEVLANLNNANIDANAKTIPAYYFDVNESSSSSLNTTGSATVGSNATGQVDLYNTSSSDAHISTQDVFYTQGNQGGLKFVLDPKNATVIVPANTPPTQPVTAVLDAAAIGSDYNIAAGTELKPVDPDPGSAVNNVLGTVDAQHPFTGGNSHTAQVVAQADQDNLLASLEKQLYAKGQDELVSKMGTDVTPVKDSLKSTDVSKSFDSNVGAQASILNLSLTTKTSELGYKQSDLDAFAKAVFANQLGNSESLSDITENVSYEGYDAATGDIKLKLQSSAKAIPVLNKTQIIQTIKSKTEGSASSYISAHDGVKQVDINIHPFWFRILHMLPFRSSQISINVTSH